jgi:hypothetical protein
LNNAPKIVPSATCGGDIENCDHADGDIFVSPNNIGEKVGDPSTRSISYGFTSNMSRDYSSSTQIDSLSWLPHQYHPFMNFMPAIISKFQKQAESSGLTANATVNNLDGQVNHERKNSLKASLTDGHAKALFPYFVVPPSDAHRFDKDLDIKMMHQFYNWPFVAITLIHFRLLFFQVTHHQFQENEGNCLISFTVISSVSSLILFMSQLSRKFIRFQNMDLPTLDSLAMIGISCCFSALLLLLTFHDNHVIGGKHGSAVFHGHQGCTLHNEFLFYVMMIPYLLYCRSIYAQVWAIYLSWMISFSSSILSLLLISVHNHAKYSIL